MDKVLVNHAIGSRREQDTVLATGSVYLDQCLAGHGFLVHFNHIRTDSVLLQKRNHIFSVFSYFSHMPDFCAAPAEGDGLVESFSAEVKFQALGRQRLPRTQNMLHLIPEIQIQ